MSTGRVLQHSTTIVNVTQEGDDNKAVSIEGEAITIVLGPNSPSLQIEGKCSRFFLHSHGDIFCFMYFEKMLILSSIQYLVILVIHVTKIHVPF